MRIPQALKQAYSQGYPESVMHVQVSIGSRNSAIHNDYHTSLRPSSLFEPRHPSLKVVFDAIRWTATQSNTQLHMHFNKQW